MNPKLLLTVFVSISLLLTGINAEAASTFGCGCCPSAKCSAEPVYCSSNVDCECLWMTVTGGGMCASTAISCSSLTRCENDNQTCSVPNTVCVNNTRCDAPVCYPLDQAKISVCPPVGSKTTTISTTTPTTTTTSVTTTTPTTTTTSVTTATPTTTTTSVTTTTPTTTTTSVTTTITVRTIDPCSNGTVCLNNGTCLPSGDSFICLCPGRYYGSRCEQYGKPDLGIDGILNGTQNSSDPTVENVLNRNNWTNIVAVVDVTGSMKSCAAAVYKWMTLSHERLYKIQYYVFFNDGDKKPDASKVIGSTGGVYGVNTGNLETVVRVMKTAMYNGNGGDTPENDIEALLYGIEQCPNCTNTILIADNQATPRDLVLLANVTRPVKVIVCQMNNNALNPKLMDIALKTHGSIHTLKEDIFKVADIPIDVLMSLPTHLTNSASPLPFFCSSNSFVFYLGKITIEHFLPKFIHLSQDDSNTYSQILTLYNPYDFAVRYKVLCTAPRIYSIAEPQGEIRPQHSVDTIIRLLDTSSSSSNQNVVHKIRIQYFDRRKPQDLIGKRDITCTILSYKPSEENFDEDNNHSPNRSKASTTPLPTAIKPSTNSPLQETRDPLVVTILSILGIICAIILVLPDNENNTNTHLPSYLHMTTNSKVIASYILGLLTVVFIRR
ncbi:unnamed protein product [Adineta ricciae]|uniref:EGF-like domain-containing protein n=1 Tax=Adineta ricciae TaxID=249248 RepID=A0A815CZT6_ADIRI|nr:unnamed protein product [Adineta ricciae]